MTVPDPLLAAYRPVRRVTAPADAPWSGMLVRRDSGESVVLVDAATFAERWAGWDAAPDGHVLAPVDVVRRADGHDVALRVCPERVGDFLLRRAASRVPLSDGETITLAVSLVRGIAELEGVQEPTGDWWLTDSGRPVFADSASSEPAVLVTASLLETLADSSSCADALGDAVRAVTSARRAAYDLAAAEERLFAAAAPQPLATAILGPRTARELTGFDRDPQVGLDEPAPARGPLWIDGLARHVDADLADLVSRSTTGMWRRLRTPRTGTRKPWLVAAVVGAIVVVAGVMWPSNGPDPAVGSGGPDVTATTGVATAGPGETAAQSPAPDQESDPAALPTLAPSQGAEGPDDLVSVTDRLLQERTACGEDANCLEGVLADVTLDVPSGATELPAEARRTTLLDEFGGVAVLRVDAADAGAEAQLVVIMLRDGRWLLRDVYAAKQP